MEKVVVVTYKHMVEEVMEMEGVEICRHMEVVGMEKKITWY